MGGGEQIWEENHSQFLSGKKEETVGQKVKDWLWVVGDREFE